jgi:hypothetical protein
MSDGSVDIEVGLTKDQFNKRLKIRKKWFELLKNIIC